MKPDINAKEYKTAISVQQMRDSDAYTIEHFVPGRELMYRAAYGVYDAIDWNGKTIAIVCGSGNNGGDGYALAGILAERGYHPMVFATSEKLSADGAYYYRQLQAKEISIQPFTEYIRLNQFDIIVDCILGTGFHGEPRGMAETAINAINEAAAYVVSVDINSGMNGDTGEASLAVKSDKTISIGYYKKGLFLGRAPELIGDLVNVDIGITLVEV